VIKAEKILKASNLSVNVTPVPRNISSDCGIALEVPEMGREKVKKILKTSKILPEGYYHIDNKGVANEIFN